MYQQLAEHGVVYLTGTQAGASPAQNYYPNQQQARSINANKSIGRGADGKIYTNEISGHFSKKLEP